MKTLRSLLVGIALVLLGLAAGVLLVETALRVFAPQPLAAVRRDPYLGWLHKPGARFQNRTDEFSVSIAYNSAGLRDVEHPPEKPEGTLRIAFVGDSFLEAAQVELDETLPRRAGSLLSERAVGLDYETINFGVAGYGTAQYLIVL
ncbi:MAG: SGNH/GDSL hydrolase family protein, partial [Candidatus Eisenbacteria bacterium]